MEFMLANEVHKGLCELETSGIVIPEEFGGVGLGFLEAALIAETLGYAVAPVPFTASSVMAPVALLRGGSDDQKQQWLPRIAAGETTIGVGVTEQTGRRESGNVDTFQG